MDGTRREAASRNHSGVCGGLDALKGSGNISVQAADKQRRPAGLQGGLQGCVCVCSTWAVDGEAHPSGERVPTCGGAAPVPHVACPPLWKTGLSLAPCPAQLNWSLSGGDAALRYALVTQARTSFCLF